ncbi:MAG: GvpL/GvpF family gas vesicle protein [Planctomycetota bacterium]
MNADANNAVYLVGVAAGDSLAEFDIQGLEAGQRTRTAPVGAGDLRAVVIEMSASMFEGEEAEARLKDVNWLGPRAARHEAIVRAARARTPLMPAGFGSVFSSTQALREVIEQHADAIGDYLKRTEGCDEWSLKVRTSRADAIERAKRAIADEQARSAGAGMAYLISRRLESEAEDYAEDRALEHVEQLLDGLGTTIEDAAERRIVSADADPDEWLIAHVALLVSKDKQSAFDETLDALSGTLELEGLRLELSGPWAPYSFCPSLGDAS